MTSTAASDDTLLLRDRPDQRAALNRALAKMISDEEAEEREGIVLTDAAVMEGPTPRWTPGKGLHGGIWTSWTSELFNYQGITASVVDAAVYPGRAVDDKTLTKERERAALGRLIERFRVEGFSWSGSDGTINDATSEAARALLNALPVEVKLPRIAPDGEGNLLMLWQGAANACLIVVSGWKLHLVENPTTPQAKYLDDVAFDGEIVPTEILTSLPSE